MMDEEPTTEDETEVSPDDLIDQAEAEALEAETSSEDEGDEIVTEEEAALETERGGDDPPVDALDVDAALAAVANLDDLVAAVRETGEIESVEIDPEDREQVEEDAAVAQHRAEAEAADYVESDYFPRPPLMTLRRGQAASTVPALLLILTGAWLTFTLTTVETPPDGALLAAIAAGGVGLSLLSQWFTSRRWARGGFFGGAFVLMVGAILLYFVQSDGLDVATGWPLVLVAAGVSFVLTALLTQPPGERLVLVGVLVSLAGLVALSVTSGALGNGIVNALGTVAAPILAIALIIILLPAVFRRRG